MNSFHPSTHESASVAPTRTRHRWALLAVGGTPVDAGATVHFNTSGGR
jgi:hypothetical protein